MASLICWLEQHDRLSGWAQFFGAMVAIAIAIAVPAVQSFKAAKQSRFERAQRLRASAEVVRIGVHASSDALEAIAQAYAAKQVRPVLFEVEKFLDVAAVMDRIEVHRLPTPGAVTAMISARHHMRDLCSAIQMATDEASTEFVVSERVERRIGAANSGLSVDFNSLSNECAEIEAGHRRWSKKIEGLTADRND